jgi:hypothetical protein
MLPTTTAAASPTKSVRQPRRLRPARPVLSPTAAIPMARNETGPRFRATNRFGPVTVRAAWLKNDRHRVGEIGASLVCFLACLRTSFRSMDSSLRRILRKRRWRSAFVLLFSSVDLAGRPALSNTGRSTDGVNIFRLLNANGAFRSARARNFRLSLPSSKIGSAAMRLGTKAHSGALTPIFPAKCSAYAASHASATFPSGNLSFRNAGSSTMASTA